MKILLDECIPRKLKYSLLDHECQTVPGAGLAGRKNGSLLDLAESAGFEIFVTMDKGLEIRAEPCGQEHRESACGSPAVGSRPHANHEPGVQRRDPPHQWRRAGILSRRCGPSRWRGHPAATRTSSMRAA